jgi:all-trans-retinol 13,14-reductase
VIEIVTPVYYHLFADLELHSDTNNNNNNTSKASSSRPNHRSIKFNQAKEHLIKRLLEVFYEQYPHIKADHLDYVNLGSPLSNNYYLGATQGEVYGLDHNRDRFNYRPFEYLLRPQQPIDHLYLTGQDICLDGICGALGGGVLTAIAIQPLVLIDLFVSYLLHE